MSPWSWSTTTPPICSAECSLRWRRPRDLTLQVIVVDNASRDDSVEVLRTRFPEAELIENRTNVGFGRANNQALPLVRGRYVLLLNTDAFVSSDTLPKTVRFMDAQPGCGVLGVKLVGTTARCNRPAAISRRRGTSF